MVWYSHLLKNFPQFVVTHTVKGFGIANKAQIDVFLELSCFFDDPIDIDNLISGSSVFSKSSLMHTEPSPGNHPDPEIKSRSPAVQADSLPSEPPGKSKLDVILVKITK